MEINISNLANTDILVVGGGLAGIVAALDAADRGLQVTLIVSKKICSGSSFYPLMEALGCQCTLDDENDVDNFVEEMNESGARMNDENLCRIYAKQIKQAILKLPDRGIKYIKMQSPKLACFAKRYRDLYLWGNWSEIRANVQKRLVEKHICLLEETDVIALFKKSNRIAGALCCGQDKQLSYIRAKSILLATGGYGNLYEHNLNTSDVSGDGHILALDVGAKLINMEFMQFIPGFIKPLYKTVFREGSLVYCKEIRDEEGNEVLKKYTPSDIDIQECLCDRSLHGPFTTSRVSKYFDIAIMKEIQSQDEVEGIKLNYDEAILEDKRENIKMYVDWLQNDKEFSITESDIFIAPFCQACNGGVWINEACETDVPGLYAAGEVAGGIHGADRHGGNASGSCLVFGEIAAYNAIQYAKKHQYLSVSEEDARALYMQTLNKFNGHGMSASAIVKEVKEIMWRYGNVIRNERGLALGLERVLELKEKYNTGQEIAKGIDIKKALRAGNFIRLAEILLRVMIERKESRGPHYREDYPALNDETFGKRIYVAKTEKGEISIQFATLQ